MWHTGVAWQRHLPSQRGKSLPVRLALCLVYSIFLSHFHFCFFPSFLKFKYLMSVHLFLWQSPFPSLKQRVNDAKPMGASVSHLIRPLSSCVTLAVVTAGCSVLPLLRPAPAPHHYSPAPPRSPAEPQLGTWFQGECWVLLWTWVNDRSILLHEFYFLFVNSL